MIKTVKKAMNRRWYGFSHPGVFGPLLFSLLSLSIRFKVFKSIGLYFKNHDANAIPLRIVFV